MCMIHNHFSVLFPIFVQQLCMGNSSERAQKEASKAKKQAAQSASLTPSLGPAPDFLAPPNADLIGVPPAAKGIHTRRGPVATACPIPTTRSASSNTSNIAPSSAPIESIPNKPQLPIPNSNDQWPHHSSKDAASVLFQKIATEEGGGSNDEDDFESDGILRVEDDDISSGEEIVADGVTLQGMPIIQGKWSGKVTMAKGKSLTKIKGLSLEMFELDSDDSDGES